MNKVKRVSMKKLICIILVLLLHGCVLKNFKPVEPKSETEAKENTVRKISLSRTSAAGPTIQSKAIWLDSFLTMSKSIRSVTRNLYLHNSTRNHNEFAKRNNELFEKLFFGTDDFQNIKTHTEAELRDRLIKSLLLVTQIQIDTKPSDPEIKKINNKNLSKNIELLEDIAGDRVDMNTSALDLDCEGTAGCLEYFNNEYEKRK